MFFRILVVIAVIISLGCIYISTLPAEFKVSRTTTISASAEKIFPHVNNLHKWEEWSPWAKLDPNAKSSFSGAEEGVGAVMSWDGNNDVGAGSMAITESKPAEFVKFKLDFTRPMEGTNVADFSFKEEAGTTTVTWSMEGTNNFLGKAMGLIFNCEKIVGGNFEKGLASLKTVVETAK